MRAAIYYRVSSEEQIDGFSLDAQRRTLLGFCTAKGWHVADEYVDEGKSARGDQIEKRPAFKRMMEDAEMGRIDVVIVHKIDRFSRNIGVTFNCLELLARHNVGFVAVAQPDLDYTRPEGRLFMGMMATLAQYYSDNLSQETKKGKAERKAQGLWNGHLPWGMMKGADGVPVANPETIEGLRLAFTLASEGRSDRDVAQALNERGYRTGGNRGDNPFTKDTICAILQNRFYLGELPGERPDGAAPVQHGAVLDPAIFAAAQDARERRSAHARLGVRRDRAVYGLSGLGVCAHCGGRMTIQTNRNRPRLFCNNKRQMGGCPSKSALLLVHEEQIGAHLAQFVIPADYRERLTAQYGHERADDDGSAARRKALESRLVRIKEMYGWGDIERAAYLAERERLQRELVTLTARDDATGDQLATFAELIGNVARVWEEATPEQRNRLARLIFEEVVIDDERVMAVKPRPELAAFFTLDSQRRGLSTYACRGGSDGARTRGPCLDRAVNRLAMRGCHRWLTATRRGHQRGQPSARFQSAVIPRTTSASIRITPRSRMLSTTWVGASVREPRTNADVRQSGTESGVWGYCRSQRALFHSAESGGS